MEMGNVPKRQQPDHWKKKTTAEGHQQVFNVARNSWYFNHTKRDVVCSSAVFTKCNL